MSGMTMESMTAYCSQFGLIIQVSEINAVPDGPVIRNTDETRAIGKRYRRGDAVGTAFAVAIEERTLESGAVTLRERDSMRPDRRKYRQPCGAA